MGVGGLRGTGDERVRASTPGHWHRADVTCPRCGWTWRATWLDGTVAIECHQCTRQGKSTWVQVDDSVDSKPRRL